MASIDDTTQVAPSQAPKGIWGWNTIPMLNLLFVVIGCFYATIDSALPFFFNGGMWATLTEGCEAYNPLLGVLIAVGCAYNFILGTLCIYALIFAARKSSTYPRLATILFWAYAIGELLDNVAANHVANVAISQDDIYGISHSFVFAVIWTSYFMQSAMIKNTFINASANWRRIRNVLAWILGASLIVCYLGMQANNPFAEEENGTEVSETNDSEENPYMLVDEFLEGRLLYEEHIVSSTKGKTIDFNIVLEWNNFDNERKAELLSGWQASTEALRRRVESQCTEVSMKDELFLKEYTSFTNSCAEFLEAVEECVPESSDARFLVRPHLYFRTMISSACRVLDYHPRKDNESVWWALLLVAGIGWGLGLLYEKIKHLVANKKRNRKKISLDAMPLNQSTELASNTLYLGLMSLLPCVNFIAAPAALVAGIFAIKDIKLHPEKRGLCRAWIGIVLGGISAIVGCAALIGFLCT